MRSRILPSNFAEELKTESYESKYRRVQGGGSCRHEIRKNVAEGDSRYAKELFTEDAVLFGFLDGALERGSIDQFYRNVDSVAAGDKFKARIDVVAVEETLAVVRVLEESWGGRIDFTDYLLLLKIDGEWRCVAKAYNQNSNTIQK